MTKKRRRRLRIFSTHITRNAIKIEISAPLASRAMISFSPYFRFPDPKTPSTSFRFRLPKSRVLFLVQKFLFFVLM
jgi:hypothetical protein